jgi:hypothetical protein
LEEESKTFFSLCSKTWSKIKDFKTLLAASIVPKMSTGQDRHGMNGRMATNDISERKEMKKQPNSESASATAKLQI